MILKESRDYFMNYRPIWYDVLTTAASIRTRESRNRLTADNLLRVPYVNCNHIKQSFEYRVSALWTSLPILSFEKGTNYQLF